MSEGISVLLVDDQKLLREGLRALLDRETDLRVVGEAGDGEEAVALYAELEPDVVLMDVQMPNVDGVTAIRQIHAKDPQAKVVILTTFDDDDYIFEGMRAGALGYLLKAMSGAELAAAVRSVYAGGAPLEPTVARKLIGALGPGETGGGAETVEAVEVEAVEVGAAQVEVNSRLPEPLSRREQEVLGLIAAGLSNRKIANRLNLAEGTVKNYVSSLIGKLNAQDRTQAAMMSKELGLLG